MKSYNGKKILITGCNGFKGTWLVKSLMHFGVSDIIGICEKERKDDLWKELGISAQVKLYYESILNKSRMKEIIAAEKPDVIYHLAAQALLPRSYEIPVETFEVNVMGTIYLLEAIRTSNHECVFVFVSSDKCYYNNEQSSGYVETDRLGGKDPYSASKAAAEIAVHSYYQSYFRQKDSPAKIASARSGNIIGGADFSHNRLVPDCIKSWIENKPVLLRQPQSVRPWQFVLEPVRGYLMLGEQLMKNKSINGEAFNFGPNDVMQISSAELVERMFSHWGNNNISNPWITDVSTTRVAETNVLKLSSAKSKLVLNWYPKLNMEDTLRLTAEWYYTYYQNRSCIASLTDWQIKTYFESFQEAVQ